MAGTGRAAAGQSAALKIADMSLVYRGFPSTDVRVPPEYRIAAPTLATAGAWDLSQRVNGKVKVLKELHKHDLFAPHPD